MMRWCLPFLALAAAGCFHGAALKQDMVGASVAPNPMSGGNLMVVPIARVRGGGMFRLITADEKEVCANGEIYGEPGSVQEYGFKMQSFATPDDDENTVPTARSRGVKVLGSYNTMGPNGLLERVTQFQTCFPNGNVFSAKTAYLVIRRDPQPAFGGYPIVAVWHFDDTIRQMHAMR